MKAVILCGGFGSRLRGVIGETQKAVAEVDGRPFLHIVVERLGAAGFDELIFCTHYQSEQVAMALDALGESVAHRTTILQEQEPLGTGGAILKAMEVLGIKGDFIALNSDTYVTAEAYRLAHESNPPSLIVREVEDCARYGAVRLDDSGNIIEMTEKGVSGPGCISMGIYRFHTDHLAGFPVTVCSMEKDILPQLIQRGLLKGIRYSGDFIDIGTPESLATIRKKGLTNFP
jgi:NDP-sugar pyrophosphorylase family protein